MTWHIYIGTLFQTSLFIFQGGGHGNWWGKLVEEQFFCFKTNFVTFFLGLTLDKWPSTHTQTLIYALKLKNFDFSFKWNNCSLESFVVDDVSNLN